MLRIKNPLHLKVEIKMQLILNYYLDSEKNNESSQTITTVKPLLIPQFNLVQFNAPSNNSPKCVTPSSKASCIQKYIYIELKLNF